MAGGSLHQIPSSRILASECSGSERFLSVNFLETRSSDGDKDPRCGDRIPGVEQENEMIQRRVGGGDDEMGTRGEGEHARTSSESV